MKVVDSHKDIAKSLIKECLILDIETYSDIDIKTDFNGYVKNAKVKWIGFYSYKNNKYYEINAVETPNSKIIEFIKSHKYIISFNGIEFDVPILKNNGMFPDKKFIELDMKVILGSDTIKGQKNRGSLMGYKFRKNSLREMAKVMDLKTLKGDIDYMIFKNNYWSEEEIIDIKKYLRGDIEVTKQLFERVVNFWIPFTTMIEEKNVRNWSWINVSIASLVYKSACFEIDSKEEYNESKGIKEELGGLVLLPKQEEAKDVWYVDVTSLYPHMYIMFNLVDEVNSDTPNAWHGNEVFKVNGYYNISKQHRLTESLMFKLKERIRLKEEDPENGLIYAYKIFLNTFYGVNRSDVFKNVHTPNSGTDCCFLGQQVNKIMQEKFEEMGYKVLAGDTDSIFVKYLNGEKTKKEVEIDCKKVVDYILSYVPFPINTFNIDIETGNKLDYIMYVPDEKTKNFKKKNYAYIYTKNGEKKVKIMGLPIKKSNATALGIKIFHKYIEPQMLQECTGKFSSEWVSELIKNEVKKNMELMAIEYRCNNFNMYSPNGRSGINAQASLHYLDGNGGLIKLIKNKKIGKIGNSFKYCTIEEAKQNNLTHKDLDLSKVMKELQPFAKGKIEIHKTKGFF